MPVATVIKRIQDRGPAFRARAEPKNRFQGTMSNRIGLGFLYICNTLLVQGFLVPQLGSIQKLGSFQPKMVPTATKLLNTVSKVRKTAFTPLMTQSSSPSSSEHETDFVVIGSGLGGLSAASLLVIMC
jgi:hypothetical protein